MDLKPNTSPTVNFASTGNPADNAAAPEPDASGYGSAPSGGNVTPPPHPPSPSGSGGSGGSWWGGAIAGAVAAVVIVAGALTFYVSRNVAPLSRQAEKTAGQVADLSAKVDGLELEALTLTGPQGDPGEDGEDGERGPAGATACLQGACVSLQSTTPGTAETGNINISGRLVANSLAGEGSDITGVDAATLSGFNAAFFTNASNISSGTLSNNRLASSVTLQGNSFNGTSQLVQTTSGGALPTISGANLTGLNASNISSGTLADGRLSSNVALLDRNSQVFTGTGAIFRNSSDGASAFRIQNAAGTTDIFSVNTSTATITVTNLTVATDLIVNGTATVNGTLTADTYEQPCDTGWVWVPGSAKYGTLPGFCVMQFEAKDDGAGNAISQAGTTPWVSISQESARAECSALGTGYHLITENEWMTIAENVAGNSANWADGTVGSTVASGGGLFRGNVGISDSVSYDGANPEFGTGRDTKARLTLSNGNELWDISGNVWEWTDEIMNAGEHPEDDTPASEWLSYTGITKYRALNYVRPPDDAWNESYGVGRLFTDVGDTATAVRAFRRGGNWSDGSIAGAFALHLDHAPTHAFTVLGFRCAR